MKLGKTFYAKTRREWRAWLKEHHRSAQEIWLIYYKKESGKPRIPYNDAVEEALCFGWIDSTVKTVDKQRFAQRFSPRRARSVLSLTNKERIRRLIGAKKMTPYGLERVSHAFQEHKTGKKEKFVIPARILKALKADPVVWKNFNAFPEAYKRIRIGWIAMTTRPDAYKTRLNYFLKMTAKNKKFGMVR